MIWRDGETWWWAAVVALALNLPLSEIVWFREYVTTGTILVFPLAAGIAGGSAGVRGARWLHALVYRGGKRAAAAGRDTARTLLATWIGLGGAVFLVALVYRPAATRGLALAGAGAVWAIWGTRGWRRAVAVVAFPLIMQGAYRLSYVVTDEQASLATWLVFAGFVAAAVWRGGKGGWPTVPIRRAAAAASVVLAAVLVAHFFRVVRFNETGGRFPDEHTAVRIVYGPPHPMWTEIPRHEIYDIKVDEFNERLFFSDRGAARIGRIDLRTGVFVSSPPEFPYVEQLVLRDRGETVATYLNPRVGVAGKDALWLDSESLSPLRACGGIRHYVDMAASLTGDMVIAAQEFNRSLKLVLFKDCREKSIRTATLWPYQVLCSAKWSACYVSGQFFSATLSRVHFENGVPGTMDALFVGPFSLGMAKDETRDLLFVARPLLGVIDIIDPLEMRRIKRLHRAPMVRAVAVAPELGLVFAPEFFTGDVAVFDIDTGEKLAVVPTSRKVREVVWSAQLEKLFVAAEECVYSISAEDLARVLPTGRLGAAKKAN